MSRPRSRSSGLSEVASRLPSTTSRCPLLSFFAGFATERSAQYRAATGSRLTVSPSVEPAHQNLGGKGVPELGRLAQRLAGLGARHQRHLVEVAAVPGFVMFVKLVIGFGIALRRGLAQQADGLRRLFGMHPLRGLHLEVHVFGVRSECHVAAGLPQCPATVQHRVADIFRRVFSKAIAELARILRGQRRFRRRLFGLNGAGPHRRQEQRGHDAKHRKQDDRRNHPARSRRPAIRFGYLRRRNHVHAICGKVAGRVTSVAASAGFVQIRAVGNPAKANLNVKDGRCSCFASAVLRVTIAPVDGRAAMRWYVSIGAVLVAGGLAGGDVAGIAAPSPKPMATR